ncbi:protoporphyrinogen oxidase [Paramicrobacterium chengjingii]|uniref:Coproporphyrinogen III oxidase n=1 Tax=Paramicrobacterium chengjingii TaxID=2769067 RepID=A0ABX6YJ06_9MICO|nr:protoporphyrinogen oxidase [Microbacterium chengjingii]QPZ38736.1 protoporphyrinogen oxidase [Microbacterium chengjingii]
MSGGVPSDRHVVVVGGGIAGLVAAYECARIGVRVTLLEADDRVGGCVRTEQIAGVDVDTGAESFATRGGTVRELIDELGLSDRVVEPSAEGAWLAFGNSAAPLPKAGVLGIPSNPLADDVRRIIGWKGAIRAYADRVKPVLTIGTERNLGELVEKRMGVAVLENLVAPVTNGVYSADPSQLDVSRAAPGLNNALTVAGSLSGAVATLRDNAPAGSAVGGFAGGMRVLVDALLDTLVNYEVRVLTATPATEIEYAGDEQWRVHADAGGDEPESLVLAADAVIVAAPESVALDLLAELVPASDAQAAPEAPVVDIVTLAVDSALLDAHPRGTGVLTAASARRTAKALTHSSAKWPWLAAALDAPHRHIVRVSFGRVGENSPLDGLDDLQIGELARTEASALLGVDIAARDVVETLRTRWVSTLPRAFAGQTERATTIRDAVTRHPGLDVTGAWLSGTGLASVIPDAAAAAARVRKRIVSEVLDGE